MDCTLIRELFKSYLDKELDGEHLYIIKNHLKRCLSCKAKIRWLKAKKICLKLIIIIVIVGISTFLIVHSTHKTEQVFRTGTKKVVSNIIIEIFSRDAEGDAEIVKTLANDFALEIINEEPLSVKLIKTKVNEFIESLNKVLVFPDGTLAKVDEFISPLNELDEVVLKIKFIKKV